MKILKVLFISMIVFLVSCENANQNELSKAYKIEKNAINDSLIEVIVWKDSLNGTSFTISKSDTLTKTIIRKKGYYTQYSVMNKMSKIEKVKLYILLDGKYKLNEIIVYKQDNTIDEMRSIHIKTLISEDSVKLILPDTIFNRTRIIIGNNLSFNSDNWSNSDTLNSQKNYISLSKKYLDKKCILSGITERIEVKDNKPFQSVSGIDIYFDLNNLINRDVKNSLLSK